MRRIGEDVAEKLGLHARRRFTVERHIRGKWACAACETLVQAPVPAHIIDKGMPTAGLLAQVLVAKYSGPPAAVPPGRHLRPGGAGDPAIDAGPVGGPDAACTCSRWSMRSRPTCWRTRVLHADETPVAMLDPGAGKTHRAYLWSYSVGAFDPIKAVVYDFADSRAGRHAQAFLGDWRGTLICDDYAGYKALIALGRDRSWLHGARAAQVLRSRMPRGRARSPARRWRPSASSTASNVKRPKLDIDARQRLREAKARPMLERLHAWLLARRTQVPNGSGIARAIDYTLKRWAALTHYVGDGRVPIDNNWIENQIRPIALGRKNWLFAGA